MKKLFLMTFVGALLLGAALVAADPGRNGGGRSHLRAISDHLAAALNLTDDQKAAVQKLHADLAAQAQPLWQQARGQRQEISALLSSSKIDPTELGQKMIASHETRQQLQALHADFETKLGALLNADQKEKYQQIQASRMSRPGGRGFGFGGVPPQ